MPRALILTRRGFLMASTSLAICASASAKAGPALYRNAALPTDVRVRDLLSHMTLPEKVAQMRSMWESKGLILNADGTFSAAKALQAIPDGIGQIARPSDFNGVRLTPLRIERTIEETVAFVNGLQRYLVEHTRLGIPALMHEETAHGYLALGATVFPIPPGLGSTWDPEIVEQVFSVAAREARVRGATVALSPVVDLIRDPRYGRVEEFYGEDPYLVSQMGIASVRGQQGHTRPLKGDHVFCTLKHFVHGAPQGGLNTAPADMSERMLRENFLVPFASIVKAANPAVIMPSYNEVEGVPSHANTELLQHTGRERLGFRGAYFSDYDGIANLVKEHHVAATPADAAVLAVNAGVDADLPEGSTYALLPELVHAGRVSEAQIDKAVGRILAMKFEAGLFENPYADVGRALAETNTEADIALARTVAEKAIVLLKNDGILPLDAQASLKLAVIGPNAEDPIYGGYAGENDKGVGILAGVRAAAGPQMTVEHADGVWITRRDDPRSKFHMLVPVPPEDNVARIKEAAELAKRSDIVLLVVGDNEAITREAVGPMWPGDRDSLDLYGQQNDLVDALLATGKPIIALLLNGRPLSVNTLAEHANALVEGWYLGQEGGHAFANVLFGKVNPGGKLTVSFPRNVGEIPAYYNRHPSADWVTYVEGKRTPLFPFGFGLSYTSFDISAPRLLNPTIHAKETAALEVDLANTGKRDGDEVVQIYIRDDVSSVPRPILELKAFKRLTLAAGERQTLRFELTPDALAFWDLQMQWAVEPGTFTIFAGSSSAQLKSATLTVL
jgi:beta-glucosidase